MTRHLLWAVGLALAASLPPYQAAAQESAGASGEAAAETSQSQADTSGSASGSASAGQSESGASASGSAQADAQASESTSGQAGSESSGETTSNSQPATSNGAANPSTRSGTSSAQNTDGRSADQPSQDASAQSSTSTSGEATVPAPEQPRTDSQQATQQGTADRNDRAGASVQGRARMDARAQQRNQEALERGLQFGQATNRGLAIREVERNSIYFRSGFRRGDIIISLHGRPIRSRADFVRFIVLHPGQRVPVVVLRSGRYQTIYVDYPQEIVQTQHIYTPRAGGAYLGVMFNAQIRDAAVVLSVTPGSPAEEAGLQAGDTILAMNGQEVRSYPDVISMIRTMRPGQEVDIVIARGRSEMQVFAVLDARADVRTATRQNVYIQPAPVPFGVEVEVNRRGNNRRLLDRDRDNDGNPDRLLPRLLD